MNAERILQQSVGVYFRGNVWLYPSTLLELVLIWEACNYYWTHKSMEMPVWSKGVCFYCLGAAQQAKSNQAKLKRSKSWAENLAHSAGLPSPVDSWYGDIDFETSFFFFKVVLVSIVQRTCDVLIVVLFFYFFTFVTDHYSHRNYCNCRWCYVTFRDTSQTLCKHSNIFVSF